MGAIIMRKISKTYWTMQNWLLPNKKSSQEIYEDYLKKASSKDTIWLDLGCGHQLFREWRLAEEKELLKNREVVVGLDYEFNSLIKHKTIKNRVRGDILKLPFKNKSFDLVTSNMVIEHLERPKGQFREISRILKDSGLFVFHTPNALSCSYCKIPPNPEWSLVLASPTSWNLSNDWFICLNEP